MIDTVRRNRFLVLGFVLGAIAIATLGLTIPPGEENGSPVAFILCCLIFPVGGGFVGSVLDEAHPKCLKSAAFPRATYEWQPVSNARRLADEARDHATKAAALGLPTGEWTDLAAFWTAWADTEEQDSTVEAAETPVERPKPPKGDAGVGNADRAVTLEALRQGIASMAANAASDTALMAHVAGKIATDELPRVQACNPPCSAVELVGPRVHHLRLTVLPTGNVVPGRSDYVVLDSRGGYTVRVGGAYWDDDTILAELRIPANTATITQSLIIDRRTFDHVHTAVMKGASATEHEVPCDCDEIANMRGDVKHRDRGRGLCGCEDCAAIRWA